MQASAAADTPGLKVESSHGTSRASWLPACRDSGLEQSQGYLRVIGKHEVDSIQLQHQLPAHEASRQILQDIRTTMRF